MSPGQSSRLIGELDEIGGDESLVVRVINIRTIKDALSRRRMFWLGCAVLGAAVGASLHLVVPAKYVAVTTLYLSEPTSVGNYTIADDLSLLNTTTVAKEAVGIALQANLARPPGSYGGSILGSVLLEVRAQASTPIGAVEWGRAVAQAFLAVRSQTLNSETRLVVAELQAQLHRLKADTARLDRAVSALSASASSPASASEVTQLVSERGADQSQVLSITTEIQQDQQAERAIARGSYVLDPPAVVLPSEKRVIAEDGLTGLVAGLALGIGIPIIGAFVSDRPTRRSEVALLLRAPVLVSTPRSRKFVPRLLRQMRRRSVRRRDGQVGRAEAMLRWQALQERPSALGVIAIGADAGSDAAFMVVRCGVALAEAGHSVTLADLTGRGQLARLLRVRAQRGTLTTVRYGNVSLRLFTGGSAPSSGDLETADMGDRGIILAIATADPAVGLSHVSAVATAAVTVVRAGRASETLLDATGQMLRTAGITHRGCILLDASTGDESFGAEPAPGKAGGGGVDQRLRSGIGVASRDSVGG